MRSTIENICKKTVSVFVLFFGFIFSLSAFGEMVGDAINCEGVNVKRYERKLKIVNRDPNNARKVYGLGMYALCLGNMEEGMGYIIKASAGGHIAANRMAALFYGTDGTFYYSHLTEDRQKFSDMIHYYEEAAKQIEAASNYPEGVTKDMPHLEEHGRISARVFLITLESKLYLV